MPGDTWTDLGGQIPDRPTAVIPPEANPGPVAPRDRSWRHIAEARARLSTTTPRRPPAETVEAKAHRLLTTGAVTLRHVTDDHVLADVQGDTDTYQVQRTPDGWSCTCPCHGPRCSHVAAVRHVTTATPRS